MSSVNKVILIGNVGKDPEIRSMPNGGSVANLSLATSESWKDKQTGEKQERTEWHRISIFQNRDRGLVDIVDQYVKKGMKIYVEGKLQTRKWQDKEGNDRYTTEIVVDQLKMLSYADDGDRREEGRAQRAGGTDAPTTSRPKPAQDEFDDDIPF